MIAFIKRRWLLLSCMVVLLACSVFDLTRGTYYDIRKSRWYVHHTKYYYEWPSPTVSRLEIPLKEFGLYGGHLKFYRGDETFENEPGEPETETSSAVRFRIHDPRFGKSPAWPANGLRRVSIPIWLPLSAILGWIVIRELRWRETACAPALPSDARGETRRSRGLTGDNRAKAADAGDITAP